MALASRPPTFGCAIYEESSLKIIGKPQVDSVRNLLTLTFVSVYKLISLV